jgi:hypothetical protein
MGGSDTFIGGAGADAYMWYVKDVQKGSNYLGADTIADFGAGDTLNLREFTKALPGRIDRQRRQAVGQRIGHDGFGEDRLELPRSREARRRA